MRLLNRNFLLLWQGQLVSQIGTQLFAVAALISLKHATESALLVALLAAAFSLPGLVTAPFGGVLIDRFSRRTVLIACDVLRGLTLLVVAAIWFTYPGTHVLSIAALFGFAVVAGGTLTVFQAAGLALIPDLVSRESLPRANSVLQTSFQIGALTAQALSGVLLRVFGSALLALFDGISYLYAAASTAFMNAPSAASSGTVTPSQLSFRRELQTAYACVRSTTGLWTTMVVNAWFKFFIAPITVLFAFYVEGHLHASAEWYGFIVAGMGVGSVVGCALAGIVTLGRRKDGLAIIVVLTAMSVTLGALGLVTRPVHALVLVILAGVMNGYVNVKLITIIQRAIVPEMRGRVFGVFTTVTQALVPVATIVTGLTADLSEHNISLVYGVCGLAMAGVTLLMAASRSCRTFLSGGTLVSPPTAGPHELPATAIGQ